MTPSGPLPAEQSIHPQPGAEATPTPGSGVGESAVQDSSAADSVVTESAVTQSVDAEGVDDENKPAPTLLEQMGGVSGLVYSSVPVLVFVGVYIPSHSLAAGIWSSVASAVAILIWRVIRKEPVQPAISGLFGVAVAAFIAYRTGSARGYFLFGIWTSLAYGGAFLLSIVARWPLAGVVWSTLNGTGTAWRSDRLGRRYYDVATMVWVLVFGARFVVQHWLYDTNQVGWLAFTRIAMGWPLTAIAALVTVWAVRKADARQKVLNGDDEQPQDDMAHESLVHESQVSTTQES